MFDPVFERLKSEPGRFRPEDVVRVPYVGIEIFITEVRG
jgi:hypothetical protein